MSNSVGFQSIQIWSQRKKPFSNKKPQNWSVRGQITSGILLQTFPSNCSTRKTQCKTRNTAEIKLIPITEATIPINRMKWKRSCSQFPSFMSEPYLSTMSKTWMHLKKNSRVFLVFANQKHISGTHRATYEQVR